jgi:hypothetical protein
MFINNDIKKQLEQLSNEEENKKCFDCGAQPARWVSLNNGIYLCHSCSEEHKKRESGLNAIKSITLEQWNKNQLNIMKKGGNKKLKLFLEENNIDTNIDKNIPHNSKLMLYYRNKLKAEAEEKLLLEDIPQKNEFLESYNIDNNENSKNNLDLNEILNLNKEKDHFQENNYDKINNFNKQNQFIDDDQLIDYPKNKITIDDEQYIFAKKNKILKDKLENSVLKKDSLLDKSNSEDTEKYTSIGSDSNNSSENNSLFQNSGYFGAVGNIIYKVWDTGAQATSEVKEKMNEYVIGRGLLYLGGKFVEGIAYIGGKIIEKGADIINSEVTKNIVHKAGEGIEYISQKIGVKKNNENSDNSQNSSYIDISDNISYDNKNYIKNTSSDIENNYNILNDKSENLL